MHRALRLRTLGVVILTLILSAAVYGFAAANIVPDTYAGDGDGDILGYTVSNVAYNLMVDGDPSDIDTVTFTLSAAAGQAYISFDGGANWTTCVIAGGTSVTCTPAAGEAVSPAATLRVVAAS